MDDLKKGVDFIGITCVFWCHDGNGNFVLSKRSNNCRDEQGTWDCGAGSMEFGEDFETTVRREVQEEYCTDPISIKQVGMLNVLREHGGKPTHWIAVVHAVEVDPKEVAIGEPHKIDELDWFTLDGMPEPLHSKLMDHFSFFEPHL